MTGAVASRLETTTPIFGSGHRPPPYDACTWSGFEARGSWGTNNAETERRLRTAIQLDPDFSLARVNLTAFLVGRGSRAAGRRRRPASGRGAGRLQPRDAVRAGLDSPRPRDAGAGISSALTPQPWNSCDWLPRR
ncbi:MAG: hypothetical protein MZV63_19865 [Marinilabiliales bacterium]|nr:hypothetical protein [Marinilabiliales bacterium]